MRVFVDTSGLLAVLDASDRWHARAASVWDSLLQSSTRVDAALHRAGSDALLAAGRRDVSLVDCVSFAAMRREGIADAFAIDRHFAEQGFRCLSERSDQ